MCVLFFRCFPLDSLTDDGVQGCMSGVRERLMTCLCECHLVTGMAFFIENSQARIGVVALGIYIFIIAYSPGMGILISPLFPIILRHVRFTQKLTKTIETIINLGPVPFSYSAEAFPLYLRDLGMSLSTAILWGFNFIVAFTFPRLLVALQVLFLPLSSFTVYIYDMILTND
jgi:hypothetical protein